MLLANLEAELLGRRRRGLGVLGEPVLERHLAQLTSLELCACRVGKGWLTVDFPGILWTSISYELARFRSFAARASTTVTGRVPARNRAGESNGERTFHIHLRGYGRLHASGYLVVRLTAQRPGGEADVVPDGSGSGRDGQHISTKLMRPCGSSRDEGGRG